LRRFGAAFLAAGLAAAFLRRFGAAFLAAGLAAAFLRRFAGAFFAAAGLAAAFLRRLAGAAFLAAAFLRFGADFLAAATWFSYQNGSIRHRTCSRRMVTAFAKTFHYFWQKKECVSQLYFLFFLCRYLILMRKRKKLLRIFCGFFLFKDVFIGANVIFSKTWQ
jgi:hypothetical protein